MTTRGRFRTDSFLPFGEGHCKNTEQIHVSLLSSVLPNQRCSVGLFTSLFLKLDGVDNVGLNKILP